MTGNRVLSYNGGGWCHSSDREKTELMANTFVKVHSSNLSEGRRDRDITKARYIEVLTGEGGDENAPFNYR